MTFGCGETTRDIQGGMASNIKGTSIASQANGDTKSIQDRGQSPISASAPFGSGCGIATVGAQGVMRISTCSRAES